MKNIRKVLSLLLTAALLCTTALSCPVTAVAADYGSTVTEITTIHSETTITQQLEVISDDDSGDLLIISDNEGDNNDAPLDLSNAKGIKKSNTQQRAQDTTAPKTLVDKNDTQTASND